MKTNAISHGYTGTLSKELVDFARRQLVNATMYKGDERRREERHPMMLPVLVVPVDEDNQPIDDPLEVIARDVSPTSVGLIHSDPIRHERLAIHMTLAGTDVDLVIALTWKCHLGPFYGSAGTYVEKLSRFPSEMACLDHQ